ncbi:MAG: hypothetical protein JOZ44_16265 [Acidobacteria bacterium]|nr:hypothetical protein [Acidobacteriota bacterium]
MPSKLRARVDSSGKAYAGSQRQIQQWVNQRPRELSVAIAAAFGGDLTAEDIEWVSPLARCRYAEYRDADFLRVVGLSAFANHLRSFWPQRGPCWDALATHRDGCILVEAKSHIAELYAGGCLASEKSLRIIRGSLDKAKDWLHVPREANWLGPLYQSANRLAYLYFLREVARVPCFLANIYFIDDPRSPTQLEQWKVALREAACALGLPAEIAFCKSVFLPANPQGNGSLR